jgi:hypothetical protein
VGAARDKKLADTQDPRLEEGDYSNCRTLLYPNFQVDELTMGAQASGRPAPNGNVLAIDEPEPASSFQKRLGFVKRYNYVLCESGIFLLKSTNGCTQG